MSQKSPTSSKGPHQSQPVIQMGASVEKAKAAMIMLHGRGADAQDILGLAHEFNQPDFLYVVPQAYRNTWYPYTFLSPLAQNEPGLSSGLQVISHILTGLEGNELLSSRIILLGFSQGACLTLEYAARNARRYGGIIGLSGGLIGPENTPRNYSGSLEGTPVFLGCSDKDPHVPKERVQQTAKVFQKLSGNVTKRFYPDLGHTVNEAEIEFVKSMMEELLNKGETV